MRRASLVAFAAIDAGIRIAPDLSGAKSGHDAHQSTVGAEIPAPEVLNDNGKGHQQHETASPTVAQVPEEVQHLDVGDDAERRHEKSNEPVHRHGEDDEEKECEKQVFQTAQRDIEPSGQSRFR